MAKGGSKGSSSSSSSSRSRSSSSSSSYPRSHYRNYQNYPRQQIEPIDWNNVPKQSSNWFNHPKQPSGSSSGSSYPRGSPGFRANFWNRPSSPGKTSVSRSGYPKQKGAYSNGGGYETGYRNYGRQYSEMSSGVLKGGAFSSNIKDFRRADYKGASMRSDLGRAAQLGLAYSAFRMYRPGYRRRNYFFVPYRPHVYYYTTTSYDSTNARIPSQDRPVYYGNVSSNINMMLKYRESLVCLFRNSGLKCHHCDGDGCKESGFTFRGDITCAPYQQCAITRREHNETGKLSVSHCHSELEF